VDLLLFLEIGLVFLVFDEVGFEEGVGGFAVELLVGRGDVLGGDELWLDCDDGVDAFACIL